METFQKFIAGNVASIIRQTYESAKYKHYTCIYKLSQHKYERNTNSLMRALSFKFRGAIYIEYKIASSKFTLQIIPKHPFLILTNIMTKKKKHHITRTGGEPHMMQSIYTSTQSVWFGRIRFNHQVSVSDKHEIDVISTKLYRFLTR